MVNKKIILPLIAALLVVVGVFAMNAKQEIVKKIDTTWYYNGSGTSESDFRNAANWSQTNNTQACLTNGNRPCHISVEASDNSALQDFFDGLGSTSVMSLDDSRKP